MTWLGAAVFAAFNGARLPTCVEASTIMTGHTASNAEYRHGDVSPVEEAGGPVRDIHHRADNVQIWCCDGPSPWPHTRCSATRSAPRGTPRLRRPTSTPRSCYLLGSSRGAGLRLVRDHDRGPALTVEELFCHKPIDDFGPM
jgi:hypothetical protein